MDTTPTSTGPGTTVGGIASRAHEALDTAVDKVAPTVNRVVDKAHETIDRVADRAAPAAESARAAMQQASDRTVRLADACANSVRAQPLVWVGSALAVGYVLGRLMSR
jgi:ElaB/YqjD/DUF883 family membrane-anchored ribosome-binding protein